MKKIFSLALLLCACQGLEEPAEILTGPATANPLPWDRSHFVVNTPFTGEMAPDEQLGRLRAAGVHIGTFWDLVAASEEPLAEQLDDISGLLAGVPERDAFLVEQHVAQYVIERARAGETLPAETLAPFVELLHKNKSQRTDLLYYGLKATERLWPEARIRAYAAAGIADAQAWQQQVANGPQLPPSELAKAGRNVVLENVAAHEAQLAQLAR